jgi:hypothetical protein
MAGIAMASLGLMLGAVTTAAASEPTRTIDPWQSGDAAAECALLTRYTNVEYDGAYKVDGAAPNGTYPVDAHGNQVVIENSTGSVFDWRSNFGIDAVIVKAGTGANIYEYTSARSGADLYGFEHRGVSHTTFCWTYRLTATKTATTSYTRTYTWTIDKMANQTSLRLMPGQQFPVDYTVTVSDTYVDSAFAVSGRITATNNTPVTFVVSSVADLLDLSGGDRSPVVNGCTLPATLDPGESLVCTYRLGPLTTNPGNGTNVATVTYHKTGSLVDRRVTARATVTFGDPTRVIDECVNVTDSLKGSLGTVCASEAPKTFRYTRYVGPYEVCGDYTVSNTASFVTNDTGATGSDRWTVLVNVPCENGCTLTQGYWKTHSEYGPAPYDDTWAQLPDGADTPFFLSGKTYYQVLRTSPGGNPYYILAKQYIAAKLNQLNGASTTPEVTNAVNYAYRLFNRYTPAQVGAFTGASRIAVTNAAEVLDEYNNGGTGPGHCSESIR